MRTFLSLLLLVGCFSPEDVTPDDVPMVVEEPEAEPVIKMSFSDFCDAAPPQEFNTFVLEAANDHGLDPWVLALTVYRESDCRKDVEGASGEIGLCQVNPAIWVPTLIQHGIITERDDLWDPETNLRAGAFIMARMRLRSRTEWEMFRRYNGSGPRARRYATEQMAYLSLIRD